MQHPPAPYSLPAHSARTLNWLFNLTHNYRGNICVFCTSATAPRRGPTAKSSQLPLQLSQPESLIKTRCFHLGQLWKKSLPEWGPLPAKAGCCRVCHVWQSWRSHCTEGPPPPSPSSIIWFQPKCATESTILHQSGSSLTQPVPLQADMTHDFKPTELLLTTRSVWHHLCNFFFFFFLHRTLSF